MKGRLFNRSQTRPRRGAAAGRRVTGVRSGLSPAVRWALECVALLVAVCVMAGAGALLFRAYFFRSTQLFVLRDMRQGVQITTGKTLTPDLISEVLGLRPGINLFSLPIEQRRRDLIEQAPNIREMRIERRLPDAIAITIVEREPIARAGLNGQVVDEEGVVFIRYAGTGGLTMIRGSDELARIKPGDRLHAMDLAAVRLVHSAMRPGLRLRLLEVDTSSEDYLLLTFSDHRQAKFAWEGMLSEREDSTQAMERQFDALGAHMGSEIGRFCLTWDARIPDRITAVWPGIEG